MQILNLTAADYSYEKRVSQADRTARRINDKSGHSDGERLSLSSVCPSVI